MIINDLSCVDIREKETNQSKWQSKNSMGEFNKGQIIFHNVRFNDLMVRSFNKY